MFILCAVSTLLFQIFALASLRRGFYVYIASLPLLPAYIAIPLVQGGAGISLSRMMTYALAVALVLAIFRNTGAWRKVFQQVGAEAGFLSWSFCFLGAKLLSTASNQNPGALFYWIDEFIGIAVVFLLAVRYVTNLDELKAVIVALLPALMIQMGVVFVEVLNSQPILQGIVEMNVSTVGAKALDGFERDGAYRALGLFDNPLSLAEYLLVGLVLLVGAYRLNMIRRPMFYLGGVFLFRVSAFRD